MAIHELLVEQHFQLIPPPRPIYSEIWFPICNEAWGGPESEVQMSADLWQATKTGHHFRGLENNYCIKPGIKCIKCTKPFSAIVTQAIKLTIICCDLLFGRWQCVTHLNGVSVLGFIPICERETQEDPNLIVTFQRGDVSEVSCHLDMTFDLELNCCYYPV